MEVLLTADQEALIRYAIEAGRIKREEDAVKEALSLWEVRERRRLELLVEVDRAEAALARGEGRRMTSEADVKQLAEDVKRRGRAVLESGTKPA